MTRNGLILLAAGGSLALLLGAFAFQHLGGLAPCKMCIWQRWPHLAAIIIGGAALALRGPALPLLGALAALVTAGIGGFHTGVEKGWWEGPASCSGGGGLDSGSLLSTELPVNVVMCDEVVWDLLGLSMASWNMAASLAFAVLWILAAQRA